MTSAASVPVPHKFNWLRHGKRLLKAGVGVAVGLYFIPAAFVAYVGLGAVDFIRNRRRTLESFNRYFLGNGLLTWLLAPFNLLMDLLCLPYLNRGIYRLEHLPKPYQDEINQMIADAHRIDLMGKLAEKTAGLDRGMIFFKWYGVNVQSSVNVPEFHRDYNYIRTIGVSIFNSKQSTGKHFGPLRITLRVLYNINDINSRDVYINVGSQTHYWQDGKLFIFDDTLLHQSINNSDGVRYCMFVDILRPSLVPGLLRAILSAVRRVIIHCNGTFYGKWTFIK